MAKKGNVGRRVTPAPQSRQKIPAWAWLASGGVLAVLLVIGLFYLGNQGPAIANNIEGVIVFPDPGRGHQEGDIAYTNEKSVGVLIFDEGESYGSLHSTLTYVNTLYPAPPPTPSDPI